MDSTVLTASLWTLIRIRRSHGNSLIEAAQLVRTLLNELDLECFVKTTGGKGLHVVLPLQRVHTWDEVKAFSKGLADHLVRLIPDRFVANMSKQKRKGKIYIDYLRNAKGATADCRLFHSGKAGGAGFGSTRVGGIVGRSTSRIILQWQMWWSG